MIHLLDANVLIALLVPDHVHHQNVVAAIVRERRTVATCPITQGAFVRFVLREGRTVTDAIASLGSLTRADWHRFMPDDIDFDSVALGGVIGHRQVTDAYLAALARTHGATLVTLDQGLAALHGDVVEMLA